MKKILSLHVNSTNNFTPQTADKPAINLQFLAKIGLGLLGLMTFSFPIISASAFTAVPPVRRADEFIDSIGVRTEIWLSNNGTGTLAQNPYKINYSGVKAALLSLGVRHIREGANCGFSDWPLFLSRMTDLKNSGIQILSPFGPASIPQSAPTATLENIITGYQNCLNQLNGVISGVEGLNEPDFVNSQNGQVRTVFGRPFPSSAVFTQEALWRAVKTSPAPINRLAVLAPSLIGPYFRETGQTNSIAYQLKGMGMFSDFNNLHTYYAGNHPEIISPNCNPYNSATCSGSFASLDNYLHLANLTASTETNTIDLPSISTEVGWRTSSLYGVPEWLQANYISRALLYNFNRGVKRSYIHNLVDVTNDTTDGSDNWGLLRFNLTPKPAYTILKNMISFLSDSNRTAKTFSTGSFNYELEPAPNPFTAEPEQTDYYIRNFPFVKTTFLQKSNRKYYIIFWKASSSTTQGGSPDPHVWFRINFPRTVTYRQYDPLQNIFHQQNTLNWIGVHAEHYPQIIEIDVPSGIVGF